MSDTRSGTPKQSYSTEKSAPNMNLFFAAATKEELAHEQEFPRSYDPKFFFVSCRKIRKQMPPDWLKVNLTGYCPGQKIRLTRFWLFV